MYIRGTIDTVIGLNRGLNQAVGSTVKTTAASSSAGSRSSSRTTPKPEASPKPRTRPRSKSEPVPRRDDSAPAGSGSGASTSGSETIASSLEEKLPVLPTDEKSAFDFNTYHPISGPSGGATSAAKPPPAWMAEDVDKFLDKYFYGQLDDKKLSSPEMIKEVPQTETSFFMRNEGDVVRASALYLLHPVIITGKPEQETKSSIPFNKTCSARGLLIAEFPIKSVCPS